MLLFNIIFIMVSDTLLV